jgi:hypothetical protein
MNKNLSYFAIGIGLGILLAVLAVGTFYKRQAIKERAKSLYQWTKNLHFEKPVQYKHHLVEDFTQSMAAQPGKPFGPQGAFTFELHRNGTFIINGHSGYAWEKSDSYKDSAFIRSTQRLPKNYKITITVGDIDYDLDKISGLGQDPEYPEGPPNENGCYLLTITDELPQGHHTNIWWHQHRKVVIDVDNNIWGHGGINPIFMVYFNSDNKLQALDGSDSQWHDQWASALTYDASGWYKVEIQKTNSHFILSVYNKEYKLIKRGIVALKDVWHGGGDYPEYFVVGDPHENYYQGSVKIDQVILDY